MLKQTYLAQGSVSSDCTKGTESYTDMVLQSPSTGHRYQSVSGDESASHYHCCPGQRSGSQLPLTITFVPVAQSRAEDLITGLAPLHAVQHELLGTVVDAGPCDDGAFIVHRDPPGIDLGQALRAKRIRTAPLLALSLIEDACTVLGHLAEHDLCHGDLRLTSLRLTPHKRIGICAPMGPVLNSICPAAQRGLECIVDAAPELLSTPPDKATIGSDVYALGVCLFRMLSAEPLYAAESPQQALEAVVAGRHDAQRRLGDCPSNIRDLLLCCLAPDPVQRYPDLEALGADLAAVRTGKTGDHAKRISDRLPTAKAPQERRLASRSDIFNVSDIEQHVATQQQASAPAATASSQAKEKILRDIKVARDKMSAWIIMGAKAAFPRAILEALLHEAGIVHGHNNSGLADATRPADHPRKIILAEGTPPRPGVPGTTVLGAAIEGLAKTVQITISDDAMLVEAFTPPGEPIARHLLTSALNEAEVSSGLDHSAIDRLCEQGSDIGYTVVARGVEARSGSPGRFEMLIEEADDGVFTVVASGDRLGRWIAEGPSFPGLDVHGREIPPPQTDSRDPGEYAGEGTRLVRLADGLYLLAEVAGAVQIMADGALRVLPQQIIERSITSDEGALETDELLLIHGSVGDGAIIKASADCTIIGDVGNACLEVGGRLLVTGTIRSGDAAITVAGTVQAASITNRQVICGGLDVTGLLDRGRIVSIGDVRVGTVRGAEIVAAGSIQVETAGGDRQPTLLWAGHHAPNAAQRDIAHLDEQRIRTERRRLSAEKRRSQGEMQRQRLRVDMYAVSGYVREDVKIDMERRLQWLNRRSSDLERDMEHSRQILLAKRGDVTSLEMESEDDNATITVTVRAHAATTMQVAAFAPTALDRDHDGLCYRRGIIEEASPP